METGDTTALCRMGSRHRRTARARGEADCLFVGCATLLEARGVVPPEVQVDFGARPTGESKAVHTVACDAAMDLPELSFPEARQVVIGSERTSWGEWEVNARVLRSGAHPGRWSRHWHDVVQLDDAGIASRTLMDGKLALSVARHKAIDSSGRTIDYEAALSGQFRLMPPALLKGRLPPTTPRCLPWECSWPRTNRSTPSSSGAQCSSREPIHTHRKGPTTLLGRTIGSGQL